MEIIGYAPVPPTMSELCRATGLHKSTVYRFLQVLEDLGYIAPDAEGRYGLAYKFLDLAMTVDGPMALRRSAHGVLLALSERLGESVQLAILEGTKVVYCDKVDAIRSLRIETRFGQRLNAHATGLGKVMLAYLPEDEVSRLYSGYNFERHTANTIQSLDRLSEALRNIRSSGHGLDDEEYVAGLKCIAAPVFGTRGNVIAALSVSGPAIRMTDQTMPEMIARVKDAAATITGRLSTAPGRFASAATARAGPDPGVTS